MTLTTDIPYAPRFDETRDFVHDRYTFGQYRFDQLNSDAFRTRIALRPVTVIRGAEAARMFYEDDRFGRDRAMPTSATHLLQDDDSVQSLSGRPHFHRKRMFVRMLSDDGAQDSLRRIFSEEWTDATRRWGGHTVLSDELTTILTRTAVRWAGIDVVGIDIPALGGQLESMLANAGRIGPGNWFSRTRRRRTESWAQELITRIRQHDLEVDPGSIVSTLAFYSNQDGHQLGVSDAATELINVLRPVVAIGRFLLFEAVALKQHPSLRHGLSGVGPYSAEIVSFVHEVRRFYPFFPAIGGTALRDFRWHGHEFSAGDWVLLDLYATNHDPATWHDPETFRPSRFNGWVGDPNTLVPEGGHTITGDRCPGERATITVMATALPLLLRMFRDFSVPDQDLRIDLRTFPAAPESGFILNRVLA